MTKAKRSGTTKAKTVSLTGVVWSYAQEMMKEDGYDNFSAYVADLIRRERERVEAKALLKKHGSTSLSQIEELVISAIPLIAAKIRRDHPANPNKEGETTPPEPKP